jgi:DNA helicase-2/ATP-dependent DNA helicase PcrA
VLEGLTDDQRRAVTHGEGPLLIVAGAGTGKTTVITRRIAWLVTSRRARPEEILALTFTDKAAAEMQERVDLLLPYGYADIQISTFHAFGDRILRRHAIELGLTPDYKILSQPEQILFLRQHLFELPLDRYRPLGDPTAHLSALLDLVARAKDEDVSAAEYLAFAEKLQQESIRAPDDRLLEDRARAHLELARTYACYQELMARHGYLDFGDLVSLLLRLFRERPALLERYQQQYRYVLVDEFQDTNYAQSVLVHTLVARHRNLTVVGDDDQSIYKFRGAAISNILQFSQAFPEAAQVVLVENFRSPQTILDPAYRLILHNNPDRLEVRNRLDKRLRSMRGEGAPVEYRAFDTISSEADFVAERIGQWVQEGLYRYSDMAVLVRTNKDADPYLRALNMQGIPYRFTGNRGLYSRPEIRLVLSFLRALCQPDDSTSLFYLAAGETCQVPMGPLVALNGVARRENLPLARVMRRALQAGDEDLDAEARASLERLLADLDRYRDRIPELSPGRLLYLYITESGWLRRLSADPSPGSEVKVQNLARFFDIVRRFEEMHPQALLPQFVEHLDLLMEAGDSPAVVEADDGEDAVQVMTVHKAKGLEFPVVFMVGLVEGRFPSRERKEPIELPPELVREALPQGDFHLQEERRLFYVAMTRARERLIMSSARYVGGHRSRRVSPFVLEALDRPRVEPRAARPSALEALHRFAPAPEPAALERPAGPEPLLTLSFRQIDDYLTCPLKYKYVHLLRVPILQHHSVIYGQALHKAVSEYLQRRQEGLATDLDFLLQRFAQAWVSQGFLSREHEEQRFAAGRSALARFYQEEESAGRAPDLVEKEFSFICGGVRVVGRWDRVDDARGEAVIVDYKSSDVRTPEEADRKARESLQLALYSLAFRDCYGRLPARLELRFLESGLVGKALPRPRDLEKAQEAVARAAAGIRARDFEPRPTYLACHWCAYRDICPATAS